MSVPKNLWILFLGVKEAGKLTKKSKWEQFFETPCSMFKFQDFQELGQTFHLLFFFIEYEEKFHIYHFTFPRGKNDTKNLWGASVTRRCIL